MPRSVSPGESVSVTLEVVSLKSKAGGSPVEFTLEPIPDSVSAAGEKQKIQTGFESENVGASTDDLDCTCVSHTSAACQRAGILSDMPFGCE